MFCSEEETLPANQKGPLKLSGPYSRKSWFGLAGDRCRDSGVDLFRLEILPVVLNEE